MKKKMFYLSIFVLVISLLTACGKGTLGEDKIGQEKDFNEDLSKQEESSSDDLLELDKYLDFMSEHNSKFSKVLINYCDLMSNDTLTIDEWTTDMDDIIIEIELLADEMIDYQDVPQNYEEAHKYCVMAMRKYKTMANKTLEAIKSRDANKMNKLMNMLDEGNDYMNSFTEKFEKVK